MSIIRLHFLLPSKIQRDEREFLCFLREVEKEGNQAIKLEFIIMAYGVEFEVYYKELLLWYSIP